MKAASASLCSLSTLLFTYPFDTVRVRQATEIGTPQTYQYKKFTKSFGAIRRREGTIRGLYSGLSIAILHHSALALLTLSFAELIRDYLTAVPQMQENSVFVSYLAAFLVLYPLDSIR
jgi:solute carrier family 25 (mitochondrial adenine nucleotide translocator), member 4/5/6/31